MSLQLQDVALDVDGKTHIYPTSIELEKASLNAQSADAAREKDLDAMLEVLEEKDKMLRKMDATTKITISGFQCKVCRKVTEHRPTICFQRGHEVVKKKVAKRFFRCRACGQHEATLSLVPQRACPKCGGAGTWKVCGMRKSAD